MQRIKKITVSLMGILAGITFGTNAVFAQDTAQSTKDSPNEAISYSVSKVPSEKEADQTSPFFDLAVKPNDEFDIEVKIFNSSPEDIKVKNMPLTTFTNGNGEVAYASLPPKAGLDKSLKVSFADIAKADQEIVEVPKNSEVATKMTIKVPENAPTGVILGSWYFEKADQVDDKKSEGISIKNKYSYALAVKMTVDHEIEKPNLNLLKVQPDLNNYRKVINAYIQNDQPAIVSDLKVSGEVTEKGKSDVLYKNETDKLTMAPNSNFAYPIFLGQDQLKAGTYTMHLKATTTDSKWGKKTWEWDQDFTIKAADAEKINKEAVQDPKAPLSIWWIVAGSLLLLLLIVFIVWQTAKKKFQQNSK